MPRGNCTVRILGATGAAPVVPSLRRCPDTHPLRDLREARQLGAHCILGVVAASSTGTLDPSCENSREDAGQAVGRRGGGASTGDGAREAPQGHHRTPARHQQRRGRGSRSGDLQADAVDAVDPYDTGDAVVGDDHTEGRQQRVAQRVPPGEQPGHQGHGRQPLRPPAAKLPHRLRLALQRRDQEQPPLGRTEIG